MRLRVTLQVERPTWIVLNYQHALSSAIYHFLEESDADYARFLHEEGYAPEWGMGNGERGIPATTPHPDHSALPISHSPLERRRFKLFTFSQLRADDSRIERAARPQDARLWLRPGRVEWHIASPVEPFLQNFATGLLASGELRIGGALLPIAQVETLPAPVFGPTMRCRCLSPLVAAVTDVYDGKRSTRYLRPKDPGWSHCVRSNLLGKHQALHGQPPQDDSLTLTFDADYLARRQGTKSVFYKETQIIGAFCPFTLTGSPEMIELAYNCGLGEKNAAGFGMLEVRESGT